jgi:Tol biopolymer transport system component
MSRLAARVALLGVPLIVLACDNAAEPTLRDERGLLLVTRGAVGSEMELWAMRPDGSARQRLTRNTVPDDDGDWSPDGRRIVYTSWQDSLPGETFRRPDIFVMNADGSGRRRLHDAAYAAQHARWSPDGALVAFESWELALNAARVWVVNADGTGAHAVTAPGNFSPEWSPDGTRLLYVSERSPRDYWTMYTMSRDGGGEQVVALDAACTANVWTPRWSRDGSRIAYTCDAGVGSTLYSIRADGKQRVVLSFDGLGAVWSPDGATLAFSSDRGGWYQLYSRTIADGVDRRVVSDSTPAWVSSWSVPRQ